MPLEDSPHLLPKGYRVRLRLVLWPIEVAGRTRWLESVRVVQRQEVMPGFYSLRNWVDVGYWDEVMPGLKPAPVDYGPEVWS